MEILLGKAQCGERQWRQETAGRREWHQQQHEPLLNSRKSPVFIVQWHLPQCTGGQKSSTAKFTIDSNALCANYFSMEAEETFAEIILSTLWSYVSLLWAVATVSKMIYSLYSGLTEPTAFWKVIGLALRHTLTWGCFWVWKNSLWSDRY